MISIKILIRELLADGININVTAVFSIGQINDMGNFRSRMAKIQELEYLSVDAIKHGDYDKYGQLLEHYRTQPRPDICLVGHQHTVFLNT